MKLSELENGQVLGRWALDIRPEFVSRYAAATADGVPSRFRENGVPVPPMAVIATGLGKLIEELQLTGGTIHAGQEVEFLRPILTGEMIYAEGELTSNSIRRDSFFATILTRFSDSAGKPVANALSTIVVPVGENK